MKVFETFREFSVFVFRYRATNEYAELKENKILELLLTEKTYEKVSE